MSVLFGHPSGNPNSHHAALAHLEAGRLAGFCVPWLPSRRVLQLLQQVPALGNAAGRLERRHFAPLAEARLIQGRTAEMVRLLRRRLITRTDDERLAYEANDWLMATMARECLASGVTMVHSYEDCSLLQFREAHRLGKACIYDMPIGYYPWWEQKQRSLLQQYRDWLPQGAGLSGSRHVRPEQKIEEMRLADLVLAPSQFVADTILSHCPDRHVQLASYGVDLEYWTPRTEASAADRPLQFLFAGQLGIRKGLPVLLEAWKSAALADAHLHLVGRWSLSAACLRDLPPQVSYHGLCSRDELRTWYRRADVFVFPSFFEGFPLVVLEAMACGLPVISTEVLRGMGLLQSDCGVEVPSGNPDALVAALRQLSAARDRLPSMRQRARAAVEHYSWLRYRQQVAAAVAALA